MNIPSTLILALLSVALISIHQLVRQHINKLIQTFFAAVFACSGLSAQTNSWGDSAKTAATPQSSSPGSALQPEAAKGATTAQPTTDDPAAATVDETTAGIGIMLSVKDGTFYVSDVLPESSAATSQRIRQNDTILAVAEGDRPAVPISGKPMAEVLNMVRGKVGTLVRLTVVPAGAKDGRAREVILTRVNLASLIGVDDATLRSLSWNEFDQTKGQYWQALANVGRMAEAVHLIERYLALHPELSLDAQAINAANLQFHAAQCYAFVGNNDAALKYIAAARHKQPTSDGFLWNDYLDGTVAFLRGDKAELQAAREKLAAGHEVNQVNTAALDRLLANFGKPYAEAYSGKSKEPLSSAAEKLNRIRLKQAEQNLARLTATKLQNDNAISQETLDQAKFEVDLLNAESAGNAVEASFHRLKRAEQKLARLTATKLRNDNAISQETLDQAKFEVDLLNAESAGNAVEASSLPLKRAEQNLARLTATKLRNDNAISQETLDQARFEVDLLNANAVEASSLPLKRAEQNLAWLTATKLRNDNAISQETLDQARFEVDLLNANAVEASSLPLKRAEQNLARLTATKLRNDNAISQEEIDQAAAAVELAKVGSAGHPVPVPGEGRTVREHLLKDSAFTLYTVVFSFTIDADAKPKDFKLSKVFNPRSSNPYAVKVELPQAYFDEARKRTEARMYSPRPNGATPIEKFTCFSFSPRYPTVVITDLDKPLDKQP